MRRGGRLRPAPRTFSIAIGSCGLFQQPRPLLERTDRLITELPFAVGRGTDQRNAQGRRRVTGHNLKSQYDALFGKREGYGVDVLPIFIVHGPPVQSRLTFDGPFPA